VYHCAQLSYTTQHRTDLIIFPLILQTIIVAQIISTGGEGDVFFWSYDLLVGQKCIRHYYFLSGEHNRINRPRRQAVEQDHGEGRACWIACQAVQPHDQQWLSDLSVANTTTTSPYRQQLVSSHLISSKLPHQYIQDFLKAVEPFLPDTHLKVTHTAAANCDQVKRQLPLWCKYSKTRSWKHWKSTICKVLFLDLSPVLIPCHH